MKNNKLWKKIIHTFFLFGVLFFIGTIINYWNKIQFSLIITNIETTILAIIFAFMFISIKTYMLYLTGESFGLKKSLTHYFKVFCISTFVEFTTFTGKIGADGFKYHHWKELKKKERIKLLSFLRSADISAFVTLISYILLPIKIFLYMIIFFLIMTIYLLMLKKKTFIRKMKTWFALLSLSTISFLIMVLPPLLIFNIFGVELSLKSLNIFLLSHGLGAISQLPLGIGAKDFSIFIQLKDIITKEQIILGIIWTRLSGEMITVGLGAIFSFFHLREKVNKKEPNKTK